MENTQHTTLQFSDLDPVFRNPIQWQSGRCVDWKENTPVNVGSYGNILKTKNPVPFYRVGINISSECCSRIVLFRIWLPVSIIELFIVLLYCKPWCCVIFLIWENKHILNHQWCHLVDCRHITQKSFPSIHKVQWYRTDSFLPISSPKIFCKSYQHNV